MQVPQMEILDGLLSEQKCQALGKQAAGTTWSRSGRSEKPSHHTYDFFPGKDDHSLSPDSSV